MSIEFDNNGRVEFYLLDLNNPSNRITIDSRSVSKKKWNVKYSLWTKSNSFSRRKCK